MFAFSISDLLHLLGGLLMFLLFQLFMVLKISGYSEGDPRPVKLYLYFSFIAFGPSLIYAILKDESSTGLFGGSVLAALLFCGMTAWQLYRPKPPQ